MESVPLRVLLVEDDKNIRQTLSLSLKQLGCDILVASSKDEAIQILKKEAVEFLLTDFKLEKHNGIEVLKVAKYLQPHVVGVVMTAFASFENAVLAIKEGAYDYLPKPFSTAQLNHLLSKVGALVNLQRENQALKKNSYRLDYFAGMTSPAMVRLEEFVNKVAPTEATILMTGDSGTGKSELAKLVHQRSPRARGPFVVVNCTSLTETLLESEIFGHVRGAFTGATQDHVGKFELAQKGTVFLDEVGDLSLTGQAKLLRFLQEKVIEKVGSNKTIPIDARVIAATNKNLEEAVRNGKFREDLYYRLNIFECALVPLRYRQEDLSVLINAFFKEFQIHYKQPEDKKIPPVVMDYLLRYSWPGNIRELRNTLERIVLLSSGREIQESDLPESIRKQKQEDSAPEAPLIKLEDLERKHIERVLGLEKNQEKAAEILGVTTVTLWRKRKQYGLP